MKISVITLQNINNYGSMLQAIATQKLLEEFGHEIEIVDYTRMDAKIWNSIRDYTRNDSIPIKIIKSAVLLPTKIRFARIWSKSGKKYLCLSSCKYYSIEDFKLNPIQADMFCVGSDQVWNSKWNQGILPEFFLTYASEGKKKFSLCSSIGKSQLDEEEKTITKEYLSSFSALSVRENSAVNILRDLGFDNVELLLDPSLLQNRQFWASLAKKRVEKSKYLLVYQLNNNKTFDEYVEKYASSHGLKLIRIGIRLDQISKNGKVYALPDIETFLSLFYYADFVITDSFHATAFSINFNKQFLVIYPKEFSSRLQSIMELTGTTDRLVTDYSDMNKGEKLIDYSPINEMLDNERKVAREFVRRVTRDDK